MSTLDRRKDADMKKKRFKPKGVCSSQIDITVDEEGIIRDIAFTGGCSGNTQGVARLAIGRKASEVSGLLRGTKCGYKNTSCPDQLAQALDEMIQGG